jgi:hypothetical protein
MSAEYRNSKTSADADIDISACEAWLLQAEIELSQWMLDKGLGQLERSHYELLGEISQHRTELSLINSAAEHSPETHPQEGRNL